jgi:hypothetical protein
LNVATLRDLVSNKASCSIVESDRLNAVRNLFGSRTPITGFIGYAAFEFLCGLWNRRLTFLACRLWSDTVGLDLSRRCVISERLDPPRGSRNP